MFHCIIFSKLLPPKFVITFISKSRRVRVLYGALRGVCSHCCIDYPFVVSPNRTYSRQTVFLLGFSLFFSNLFEKTVQCKSTSRIKEKYVLFALRESSSAVLNSASLAYHTFFLAIFLASRGHTPVYDARLLFDGVGGTFLVSLGPPGRGRTRKSSARYQLRRYVQVAHMRAHVCSCSL